MSLGFCNFQNRSVEKRDTFGLQEWLKSVFIFYFFANVNFFDDNFFINDFDTLLSFLACRRRILLAVNAFLHRVPSILEQFVTKFSSDLRKFHIRTQFRNHECENFLKILEPGPQGTPGGEASMICSTIGWVFLIANRSVHEGSTESILALKLTTVFTQSITFRQRMSAQPPQNTNRRRLDNLNAGLTFGNGDLNLGQKWIFSVHPHL